MIPGLDRILVSKVLAVLAATYISSKLVSNCLTKILARRSFPEKIGKKIVGTSKIVVYFLGLFVLASILGVSLGSVVVALGALSIAISFATSTIIQNLVSGILLLGDKSLRIGDKIKINGQEGRVVKIGIRTTILETDEGDTILIPNSMFMTKPMLKRKRNYDTQVLPRPGVGGQPSQKS